MKEEIINKEKQFKKQYIIESAEKLFFSNGFKSTSMDQLAKECGFTKRTIYSYFPSKDEIYYEIMLKSYKKLNELLIDESNKVYETEVKRLKAVIKVMIDFSKENSDAFKIIFNFPNDNIEEILKNSVAEQCYEQGEIMTSVFINILKNGIAKGEFKENLDVEKIFLTLWADFIGTTNLMKYKEEYLCKYFKTNASEILEYSIDLTINYIRKDDINE